MSRTPRAGGVDSSYLAFAAHRELGENALAVTARSPSYPASHREMAERIVSDFGIAHRFVETREMEDPDYRANRPDRCYHCKSELFRVLGMLREQLGFDAVAYGVNTDDTGDFRPGHRAAEEQHHPAREVEEHVHGERPRRRSSLDAPRCPYSKNLSTATVPMKLIKA